MRSPASSAVAPWLPAEPAPALRKRNAVLKPVQIDLVPSVTFPLGLKHLIVSLSPE